MNRSPRWMRAMRAGARTLNREKWDAAVKGAIDGSKERWNSSVFDVATNPQAMPKARYEAVKAGDVVFDAQTVLDIERALVEAEQVADEIRKICDEEINTARRDRLHRMIDDASARAMQALLRRGES